jgi:hypothetical protein
MQDETIFADNPFHVFVFQLYFVFDLMKRRMSVYVSSVKQSLECAYLLQRFSSVCRIF